MERPATVPNPMQLGLLSERVAKLRIWLLVFMAAWLGGAVSMLFYLDRKEELYNLIGLLLLAAAFIPYVVAVVYSYLIQKQLNDLKLYKPGAWQVIVAAIILNPWCIGFIIPLSVVMTANKIKKQLRAQGVILR